MEMSKTPHTHGNTEEYTFYMLQDACDVKYSYKRLIDISLSDRMSVFLVSGTSQSQLGRLKPRR